MGTRSVIAIPLDNGFKGRYCHSDGYPSHMATELVQIVRRDGVETARRVLTEDYASWSCIDSTDGGYGRPHTDIPADEFDTSWIENKGDDAGTEWAYVLNDTALSVLQRVDEDGRPAVGMFGMSAAEFGGWEHLGDLPYDADVTFEAVTALECGAQFERCQHYAWFHVDTLDRSDGRGMQEYLADQSA